MTEGGAPVRIGVIGTGAIRQVMQVPIFAEREDVAFRAIAPRMVRTDPDGWPR